MKDEGIGLNLVRRVQIQLLKRPRVCDKEVPVFLLYGDKSIMYPEIELTYACPCFIHTSS